VGCLKGGLNVNPNDPGVQTALKVAMEEYNKASPDIYLYKVMKVLKVQIKVGFEYTLTVTIARTVCKKGSMAESCPVFINPDRAKTQRCTFLVCNCLWRPQWMLLDQKCS
uniref:Cystatin domain-containing protein n=1 Tax=Oryzias latipes TaxID=8090 RepID=A0A3P9GY22_ORYLA